MKALQRKRLEKTTTLINEAREAYDRRNLEKCWKLIPRIIEVLRLRKDELEARLGQDSAARELQR